MITSFGVLLLLAFGQTVATPTPKTVQSQVPASQTVDVELSAELLKVRRIYVDSFGDDTISKQLRAMVIDALAQSKRFIVTENKDKADAVLKGTGLEKTSQEYHAIGESTDVGTAAGGQHGEVNGTVVNGNGSVSGSSNGGFIARRLGTSDSQASTETVDDARLAARLVSTDGDVIWATTKESKGAKYKGASADVADQIVKQLLWDLDKLKDNPKQP